MKRLIPLVLLLAAAWPAGSSKIIGNGGDVLVCPTRNPRVQLLDFVESRILRKKSITLWIPPGNSYLEKLTALTANLGRRFPNFVGQLETEIANFEAKNVKENDIELEDINDSYHKVRLPGCHVEQIANQSVPMFEDDPWFLINNNLWTQLDETNKAGLVLHEVLYRIGLRHGVEHSIGIRYLVSLMFQEKLEEVTDQQWIEAFLHSRVRYYESGGLYIPLFRGAERDCEVVPGTVECKGGDAEFKPATIKYNDDRSLSMINFEGIGEEAFKFSFGEYDVTLLTERILFGDRTAGGAEFVAAGRLSVHKIYSNDLAIADVRGQFNPVTGYFRGDYRFIRADLKSDEGWIAFDGPLSKFYALRPPWTDFGGRR